jgi:hypothetical protein
MQVATLSRVVDTTLALAVQLVRATCEYAVLREERRKTSKKREERRKAYSTWESDAQLARCEATRGTTQMATHPATLGSLETRPRRSAPARPCRGWPAPSLRAPAPSPARSSPCSSTRPSQRQSQANGRANRIREALVGSKPKKGEGRGKTKTKNLPSARTPGCTPSPRS